MQSGQQDGMNMIKKKKKIGCEPFQTILIPTELTTNHSNRICSDKEQYKSIIFKKSVDRFFFKFLLFNWLKSVILIFLNE